MKKIIKVLTITLALALIGLTIYIHATRIAPTAITTRKESITSSSIPSEMEGVKIVFFSDVHYNGFVDYDRFLKVVKEINKQNPDIVLFGGDLFDHPANTIPTEEQQDEMIELLSMIDASLGKFAVLGNHDLEAESSKELISSILIQSQFEIITNKVLKIRNKKNDSILLVGLDSEMLGNPEIDSTFSSVQTDDFTIVLCHTPDTILKCNSSLVDLFLAGHSHGGQVYLPFIGALYKSDYAQTYYRGKHDVEGALLDITNGTGTTQMDVRLFAEAEIVVYTLHSSLPQTTSAPVQDIIEITPEPIEEVTPTPDPENTDSTEG